MQYTAYKAFNKTIVQLTRDCLLLIVQFFD
jgi:hypothetical protein